MIPAKNDILELEGEYFLEQQPSQTFSIDFENEEMDGFTDGLDAMRQAIFCILNTERFEHLIYSWDYGSQLHDLIGIDSDLALPEIERIVTEALLEDDRIIEVDDFEFDMEKGVVFCSFRVITIFGELEIEHEIVV